ncbi:hypothetical protein ACUXST_000998 [Sphingomonas sp. F9_3S_D5_B_2]
MSSADRAKQFSELHQRGLTLLHDQTRALDALIDELNVLDDDKDQPTIRIPLLMAQATVVSLHSVIALTRTPDMAIRDGFGIARSAVETALNAAYIAAGGTTLAEQAIRHMRQKRWRDLNREAYIDGARTTLSLDVGLTPNDLPGLSSRN